MANSLGRLFTLAFLLGIIVYVSNVDATKPKHKKCGKLNDLCNGLSKNCCEGVDCHYSFNKATGTSTGRCVQMEETMAKLLAASKAASKQDSSIHIASGPDLEVPVDPKTGASLGDGEDGDEYDEEEEEYDDHFDYDKEAAQQKEAAKPEEPEQKKEAEQPKEPAKP